MNKDPNFVNKHGETPLFKAKTAREVELLVSRGADVNAIRKGNFVQGLGMTPLFRAKTVEVQAALLVAGANPNAVDELGRTPLFSVPPDPAFTDNLIRAGADVNWADLTGNTPLFSAVFGYPDIVTLLLAAGANGNSRNYEGQTPLFWANDPDSAELLLQYGADPFAVDNEGNLSSVEAAVVARAAHRRKGLLSVVAHTSRVPEPCRRAM